MCDNYIPLTWHPGVEEVKTEVILNSRYDVPKEVLDIAAKIEPKYMTPSNFKEWCERHNIDLKSISPRRIAEQLINPVKEKEYEHT